MAFELLIKENNISGDGKSLGIDDVSDWSQSLRTNYALITLANYIPADLEADVLEVVGVDPETDAAWTVVLTKDGRIQVTCYSYLKAVSTDNLTEGDVRYLTDLEVVEKYSGGTWIAIDIDEQIASAEETSNLLDLSILVEAIDYKNQVNLEYIAQIKSDLAHGAQQNELYYKRTDLDYINSLIVGAEYNFGLALFTIYYNIVENLNLIVSTGKIS